MKTPLEHFKDFAKVPRCSYKSTQMKEYIIAFAKSLNFNVLVDKANNILCQKGTPNICLQAHYDMVCIGDTHDIKLIEDNGWIRALNSTLGADNGIAIAIAFSIDGKFSKFRMFIYFRRRSWNDWC